MNETLEGKEQVMKKAELPPCRTAPALEPYYDARTVELHHGKHHQAYVSGLNAALDKLATARAAGDFALIKHREREVAFLGGGHVLHAILWTNLCPGGGPTRRSARERAYGGVRFVRRSRRPVARRNQRGGGLRLGRPRG